MIQRCGAALVVGWLIAAVPAAAALAPAAAPAPAFTGVGQAIAARGADPDDTPATRGPARMLPSQFAAVITPRQLTGSKRPQIVLRTGRVELMVGAGVVWSGKLSRVGVGSRTVPSLADIGVLLARTPYRKWLSEGRPGVYVLRASLVQAPGTNLKVAQPRVKVVRLLAGKEVYMSGVAAKVTFEGVQVTSWRPAGGPEQVASLHRPFISYDKVGSSISALRSRFSYLGSDSILGYGVTWGRGSTGSATGSTFDHNFFGAYTNQAVAVAFRGNVFRDNDLYGLDPHSSSGKLIVDDNDAYRNGTHGIIFSEDVVDSTVTNNRSYDNGSNGIMMDNKSDRNVISDNRTWNNAGDGIVLQNSSYVVVKHNIVTGNRVGIRVSGSALSNRVTDNRLAANVRGLEAYSGPEPATAIRKPNVFAGNRVDGTDTADGISVKNFAGVRISNNSVSRYANGIVISGASRRVGISGNRVNNVRRGIDIGSASPGARLSRNIITNAPERGIILSGLGSISQHDTVTGSDIGIDVRNTAEVQHASVTGGRRGFNMVAGAASVLDATVVADEIGFSVDPGVTLDLRESEIEARYPIVGATFPAEAGNLLTTPPPPFQWLALAGALFIVSAVVLHLVHRARSPMSATPSEAVPRGVRNAW
jgi:parallel beta-helix repeat protein